MYYILKKLRDGEKTEKFWNMVRKLEIGEKVEEWWKSQRKEKKCWKSRLVVKKSKSGEKFKIFEE